MAPLIPILAPSEAKSRFINQLGLDKPERQHLYALMKAEAAQAWQRLQSDRGALLLHLQRGDVHPPFSNSQISETAMHREILRVFRTASPETRACYDLAHDTGSIEAENWIIRWCLWHVFRDRDQRKRSRRSTNATTIHDDRDKTRSDSPQQRRVTQKTLSQVEQRRSTFEQKPVSRVIMPYDPVRDC